VAPQYTSVMNTTTLSPWMLGDFHVIGAGHTIVGETLCEDAGLSAGMRALDVACGSGNTTLAAARRGCRASGLDLVPALIERARVRAQAEGFNIEFTTGNAEKLPFEDGAFDAALSTFGVMFAPDQERAANELLRVCKPGGTIALANWTPESMPGAMFALSGKFGLAPPGPHAPIEWGTVPGLKRLFDGKVSSMRICDRIVYARAADAAELLARFKQYFGPTIMLFERVPAERHAELEKELLSVYARYNRATDGTLAAAMSYVNVVMTKGA
jgi:SAM-dependent methyltransferase